MTRTSKFAVVTLAAIAAMSLASTGASAHGVGGGGGHSFAGGFSGPMSPVSPSGGFAHGPLNAPGIARSSVVPRLVGSAKTNRRIPTQTLISQFPKGSTNPPPPPGNNNKPGWGRGGFGGFASVDDVATDNCLIKQYLPNGRVMFKDICTRETALSR